MLVCGPPASHAACGRRRRHYHPLPRRSSRLHRMYAPTAAAPARVWWQRRARRECRHVDTVHGHRSSRLVDTIRDQAVCGRENWHPQEDTNLAVLDAACGATVVTADADRMATFLEKTSFVNHTDRISVGEVVSHIAKEQVTQRIWLPLGPPEHVLKAVGIEVTADFSQLPTGFAFSRTEQTGQIQSARERASERAKPEPMRRSTSAHYRFQTATSRRSSGRSSLVACSSIAFLRRAQTTRRLRTTHLQR